MIGVARGLFIGWRAAALCALPFLGVAFLRLLPPGANSLTALMRTQPEEIAAGDRRLAGGSVVWVDASPRDQTSGPPGALKMSLEQWEHGLEKLIPVWDDPTLIVVSDGTVSSARARGVARKLRQELPSSHVVVHRGSRS